MHVDSFTHPLPCPSHPKLHHAVVDHVSDVYVDPCHPLDLLVAAAQKGDKALVQARAEEFCQHADEMGKVDVMCLQAVNLLICMCLQSEQLLHV